MDKDPSSVVATNPKSTGLKSTSVRPTLVVGSVERKKLVVPLSNSNSTPKVPLSAPKEPASIFPKKTKSRLVIRASKNFLEKYFLKIKPGSTFMIDVCHTLYGTKQMMMMMASNQQVCQD